MASRLFAKALPVIIAALSVPAAEAGDFHQSPGHGGPWPWHPESAIELRVNGTLHSDRLDFLRSPLSRSGNVDERPLDVYSIELLPGLDYTLGLSYPAANRYFRVTLFDRWPFAPGAKAIDLPSGPVVRTNKKKIEYRWHIGISKESTSPLLFVGVSPAAGWKRPPQYSVYLTTPPAVPRDLIGQGITYLRGPSDLVLTCEQPKVLAYLVEKPETAINPTALTLPIVGDLIDNGWFRDGLNNWVPHMDYRPSSDVSTVALLAEGVRFKSDSASSREGVMQMIEKDVSDAESLVLRADVKVEQQSLGGTGIDGNSAPVAISLCYEDVTGAVHCDNDIFRTGFFSLDPADHSQVKNGQKVPAGKWYRYMIDLMQLEPKPKKINFISLEGSGVPAREGWVRDVHMVKRTKTPGGN